MSTLYDWITVAAFLGLGYLFLRDPDQSPRRLIKFLLTGVVLAVANQLGNRDAGLIAWLLIVAAAVYGSLLVLKRV